MDFRKKDKIPSRNHRSIPVDPQLKPAPTEPVTCPTCAQEFDTIKGAVDCWRQHERERGAQ